MVSRESISDATIPRLGDAKIANPMKGSAFVDEALRFPLRPMIRLLQDGGVERTSDMVLEIAGPRERVFFDPYKARAAIVTCGGLCPGINSVIQAIVMNLYHHYGVRSIIGVKYGLEGFIPEYRHDFMDLLPENVKNLHRFGGTILGSSRGPQPVDRIVDCLEQHDVQLLFLIGGNGTMKAAQLIYEEVTARGLKKSIVGIPKTIDNDIYLVTRSFGFGTAVGAAQEACEGAHVEAEGAYNGIGLVRVMGRDAGFIGAHTTLASNDVNFLLVPELDFDLDGPKGFLVHLEKRIVARHHALVLVSEGAGQRFFTEQRGTDQSGNVRYGDIGVFLKQKITEHFGNAGIPITLKYIDPSYIIRSVPPSADDNIFCGSLGQHSVHAAMSGRTGLVVAERSEQFIHLPISECTKSTRRIDLNGSLWQRVLETTGQPRSMTNA